MTPQPLLTPDAIAPDISQIVIEDDVPVDNFQSEKQQRLLVEPLYSSSILPKPFIAAANVGVFYALKESGIVPDVFLSLGVVMPQDWSIKQNRSYFVWEFGKVPDVAIEIVSNKVGGELDSKKDIYAQIGVPYYIVFDPLQQLQGEDELNGELLSVWVLTGRRYIKLTQPFYLNEVGLGLTVWDGSFEEQSGLWLRWCRQDGMVVPTGKERADALAERLRAMGVDPEEM